MAKENKGYIHLYVGDGKGKTTSAIGLSTRALGSGKRVLFCQFLKAKPTSEIASLTTLGAVIMRAKHIEKFTFQMSEQELADARIFHKECLQAAAELVAKGEIDLVILDESVDAVNAGLLTAEELAETIKAFPPQVEVVMTGRNPAPELLAIADYHTDFVCQKHPFQQGVPARKGIEF